MTDHPTHATIIRRRVNIDFAAAKSGNWHNDNKRFENVLNALSFVFPAGEKFFIHSVQNYQERITDPVLKEEAKRFIYQEAMHTKEHARSNVELKQAHSYGSEMEKLSEAMLAFGRWMPKSSQLATTCALEHFTAMLADGLLRNQQWLMAESDPAFAALWLWHAVEETEHKAVCFDVYQHVCGKGPFSYLHRVFAMFMTSLLFLGTMGVGFMVIKWKQRRRLKSPSTASPGARVAPDQLSKIAPKLSGLVGDLSFKLYFDYYRPSFHPWNHKNAHLIDEWKQNYANFGAGPDAALSEARA